MSVARDTSSDVERRETLLAEYAQVNENFRLLTNIRFKLLAFLPVAPAAAFAVISASEKGAAGSTAEARVLALGVFGAVVTAGLATYNARNDQIYLWHVDRAAAIEHELSIPDGSFSGRPNSWLEFRSGRARWLVGHVSSVTVIYSASVALWLFLAMLAGTQLALGHSGLSVWQYALALIFSTMLVAVANRGIRSQRERRRDEIATHAGKAVEVVEQLERARAGGSAQVAWDELVGACQKLASRDWSEQQRRAEIELRIAYYGAYDPDELRRLMGTESPNVPTAALYVSLLVDLPATWLVPAPQRRPGPFGVVEATHGGLSEDIDQPYDASTVERQHWYRRPSLD